MNDHIEERVIDAAGKNLFFSCFSRSDENLAMYKMYADSDEEKGIFTGAALKLPFDSDEELIDGVDSVFVYHWDEGAGTYIRTDEEIPVKLYWTAVGYVVIE